MDRKFEGATSDTPGKVGRNVGGRSGRFRHIKFADAIDGAERALNLAPVESIETEGAIDVDEGAFLQWLFKQAGLDVRNYRSETLARRLPSCLRKLRVANVGLARAALLRNPSLVHDALTTMLIGVTGFFRDAPVFDELANRVLPDLLRTGRPLRIWSAACSDGPELYSIAMLLSEMGAGRNVELLGTDCRLHATRTAARGVYDLSAMRGLCDQRRARHFDCLSASHDQPHAWQIKAPLRAMVRWRTADLLTTIEPGPWDLILFRNAAMYLRCQATAGLWEKLSNAVARGGYLVLGKAERPAGNLGLAATGHYLFRRSG
jgi:chemotaxis protein methyltransferase CheR